MTDLNALIKKAETANAADPNFIADLKKLSAKYPVTGATASTAGPGLPLRQFRRRQLHGQSGVEGLRRHLEGRHQGLDRRPHQHHRPVRQQQGQRQRRAEGDPRRAAAAGAAIDLRLDLHGRADVQHLQDEHQAVSVNKNGPLNIGPYQGASASSGYRLVYQPGNETGLVLQRIVGNQVTQVGAYNDPVNLEDGKVHEIAVAREATGKMRVYVDGQQLIIATDTQIAGQPRRLAERQPGRRLLDPRDQGGRSLDAILKRHQACPSPCHGSWIAGSASAAAR